MTQETGPSTGALRPRRTLRTLMLVYGVVNLVVGLLLVSMGVGALHDWLTTDQRRAAADAEGLSFAEGLGRGLGFALTQAFISFGLSCGLCGLVFIVTGIALVRRRRWGAYALSIGLAGCAVLCLLTFTAGAGRLPWQPPVVLLVWSLPLLLAVTFRRDRPELAARP